MSRYVPDVGDIVWVDFDPKAGHEQAGHSAALVISPAAYNGKSGLMMCCPMTTQIKGYPFEVVISGQRQRAALADQICSLDWVLRHAQPQGKATPSRVDRSTQEGVAI